MSQLFLHIVELVNHGEVKISAHGYDELSEDDIKVAEVVAGLQDAVIIEEYPDYQKGPCMLVLEHDFLEKPIHAVWGIPMDLSSPAVLVTAYRPNEEQWSSDYLRRKQ
jgi:hypothetical protein